jgi:tellurite resistance protein TerC
VLVFIGFKMLINHYYAEKIISTELSLLVTLLLVIGSIVVSLFKTRHSKGNYMVGWVPGSSQKNKEEE